MAIFICLMVLFHAVTTGFARKDVVTCVYTSWSATRRPIGRVMGEDVPENKIFTLQPMLDDKTNGGMGNIANFAALKEKKQGLKALIGIGGWNSGGWIFSTMAETLDGRRIFIQSLIDFCGDNNFDGVFLDWLTPGVGERGGAAHDYENYGSLLTEMRNAFDAADGTKLIIGVTVSAAEGYVGNYDAEKVNQAADLVYLIAYDLSGYWNGTIMHPSAIFNEDGRASVDVALNLWLDAGISPGKIVLGIPTFARTYKLPNDTEPANAYGGVYNYDGVRGSISQAPGFLYYSETCARLQLGGYTVVRDPIMKVPYAFSADQIIMYDDEISIKEKVDYAKGLSLGGVYLFTVDEDDPKGFCGDPYPLSRAAAAAMTNGKVALGTPRVSTTQRCISAEKKCQEKVKCLIYPTMTYANASSDLWCGKEAVCVDPVSIVECPFPSSLKDPFQSKSSIFVSKGKSISTVKCKADLKNSSSKVAKINYLCTQEGILGKSLQEYVCPADTVFTPLYLKCVVSGKVADF